MCTGDEGLEIVSVHLYLTRKVRIEGNESRLSSPSTLRSDHKAISKKYFRRNPINFVEFFENKK